jgi:hypothetical protein
MGMLRAHTLAEGVSDLDNPLRRHTKTNLLETLQDLKDTIEV